MSARSTYHWIPNALTTVRLLLVVPIFACAVTGAWGLGFWLVVLALLTDFLDGLAAVKLHAITPLGERLDPLADFTLAATGICAMIYTGDFPVWGGVLLLWLALLIGYIRFYVPLGTRRRTLQPLLSLPLLFSVWIGTAWYFATQAYGWSWWYVAITIALLLLAVGPKRHRLAAWFGWLGARR